MNELRLIQKQIIRRLNDDGVNPTQIARTIGVSKGWISLYSRGMLKNPSIERVADLLDALNNLDEQNSINTNNEVAAPKTHIGRITPQAPESYPTPASF